MSYLVSICFDWFVFFPTFAPLVVVLTESESENTSLRTPWRCQFLIKNAVISTWLGFSVSKDYLVVLRSVGSLLHLYENHIFSWYSLFLSLQFLSSVLYFQRGVTDSIWTSSTSGRTAVASERTCFLAMEKYMPKSLTEVFIKNEI